MLYNIYYGHVLYTILSLTYNLLNHLFLILYHYDGKTKCPGIEEEIVSTPFDDVNQCCCHRHCNGHHYKEFLDGILDEER